MKLKNLFIFFPIGDLYNPPSTISVFSKHNFTIMHQYSVFNQNFPIMSHFILLSTYIETLPVYLLLEQTIKLYSLIVISEYMISDVITPLLLPYYFGL